MTQVIYVPTEEEIELIEKHCHKIIDVLSPLSLSQKYFALKKLVQSFEDVMGINSKKTRCNFK